MTFPNVGLVHSQARPFFLTCYEQLCRLDACLGGAALAHTGLSFVPSLPSFFRFDVLNDTSIDSL